MIFSALVPRLRQIGFAAFLKECSLVCAFAFVLFDSCDELTYLFDRQPNSACSRLIIFSAALQSKTCRTRAY
ncbi:MAG TPA: hypothetical protein DDZ51_16980 [Planctomycetaceae bacterium]|nr:hypothetical protein [Planctomycetaceae bacterium]